MDTNNDPSSGTTLPSHLRAWHLFVAHRWLSYTVPFGAITEPFRFEFRVTRGLGDNGHFALDNIFLDSCSHGEWEQRAQ